MKSTKKPKTQIKQVELGFEVESKVQQVVHSASTKKKDREYIDHTKLGLNAAYEKYGMENIWKDGFKTKI